METRNRLTVTRGEEGEGQCWKEGEGTGQTTCMNDPWTWTTVWALTAGVGVWDQQRRAKGENWDN